MTTTSKSKSELFALRSVLENNTQVRQKYQRARTGQDRGIIIENLGFDLEAIKSATNGLEFDFHGKTISIKEWKKLENITDDLKLTSRELAQKLIEAGAASIFKQLDSQYMSYLNATKNIAGGVRGKSSQDRVAFRNDALERSGFGKNSEVGDRELSELTDNNETATFNEGSEGRVRANATDTAAIEDGVDISKHTSDVRHRDWTEDVDRNDGYGRMYEETGWRTKIDEDKLNDINFDTDAQIGDERGIDRNGHYLGRAEEEAARDDVGLFEESPRYNYQYNDEDQKMYGRFRGGNLDGFTEEDDMNPTENATLSQKIESDSENSDLDDRSLESTFSKGRDRAYAVDAENIGDQDIATNIEKNLGNEKMQDLTGELNRGESDAASQYDGADNTNSSRRSQVEEGSDRDSSFFDEEDLIVRDSETGAIKGRDDVVDDGLEPREAFDDGVLNRANKHDEWVEHDSRRNFLYDVKRERVDQTEVKFNDADQDYKLNSTAEDNFAKSPKAGELTGDSEETTDYKEIAKNTLDNFKNSDKLEQLTGVSRSRSDADAENIGDQDITANIEENFGNDKVQDLSGENSGADRDAISDLSADTDFQDFKSTEDFSGAVDSAKGDIEASQAGVAAAEKAESSMEAVEAAEEGMEEAEAAAEAVESIETIEFV